MVESGHKRSPVQGPTQTMSAMTSDQAVQGFER